VALQDLDGTFELVRDIELVRIEEEEQEIGL
jgi:hypothetical protein